MKKQDIRIRDPFVVPVANQNCYYMFGTTGACWASEGKATELLCYRTADFITFSEPITAFKAVDFWSEYEFWAPEVYLHNGEWYMFATFKQKREFGGMRGTAVLKSSYPQGPYEIWSNGIVTPPTWESLDGTFYVDDEKQPWMIFCHEWTQTIDGEVCAVKLSQDLKSAVGDVVLLFKATDAPWSDYILSAKGQKAWVTDGPFVFKSNGKLLMLWSSFHESKYAIGIAQSTTGHIDSPWEQKKTPLLKKDCGHGMIFTDFDNTKFLAIHQSNSSPNERLSLILVSDIDL